MDHARAVDANLLDCDRITMWMDAQGLEAGPLRDIERLTGGTQNIVIRFFRGDRGFILRRPPPNTRAESNETMRREARVLAALRHTEVPHPELIAACGDESVLGVAFYLMKPVAGFNATSGTLPEYHARSLVVRRDMGLATADAAAALGRVDYKAVGLEGFGKPDNYLERQVARWKTQLEGYGRYTGWPGPSALPGVTEVERYLEHARPQKYVPGILHGDYSLGNVMFRYDSADVAAIIDWELATIGDPLLDLGWLLATWRGVPPVELPVLVVEPWDGFPTPNDLIERYAAQSERDLSHIDWYMVLACYKLGILLEGTHARACAGLDPVETGRDLHRTATGLFQRALHRIG